MRDYDEKTVITLKNRIYTNKFYFQPIVDYDKVIHVFAKNVAK